MKIFRITALFAVALIISGCGDGKNESQITASGNIEATNVTISSKVSGQVKIIKIEEGDRVEAGDTLLIIDHDLLDLQLKQALAGKEIADAQLSLLRKGARAEDLTQAAELLKQTEINFESAKKDLDRFEKLYASNAITKKQIEDITARYEITITQKISAQENLKKLKNLARPEEIKQSVANLNRAGASVDLLKKNISDSYVTSPVGGIIVKKFVETGESAAPLSSLVKLADLKFVNLIIYVSERELGKVKLGQTVKIFVDAFDEKTFKGKVIYISSEAEFTPKNIQTKDERTKLVFAVKIHIPNPDFELKPGMPADAVIELN